MSCDKCTSGCSSCLSSCPSRYTGPDIPELGITSGQDLDTVIIIISEYVTNPIFSGDEGSVSALVNNGNGTATHSNGAGTDVTFEIGQHSSGPAPHNSPILGDTWYDTDTDVLSVFANDGGGDIWVALTPNFDPADFPRFKHQTLKHAAPTQISLDPTTSNKREIWFESTGDMLIDGLNHNTEDDYTYLLVNTTSASRLLSFINVAGAFLRTGGTIADLSTPGLTIPGNSSILITVTNDAGVVTVNGHFLSVVPVSNFEDTITLIQNVPFVLTVPGIVLPNTAEDTIITIYDSSGIVITPGLLITASGNDFIIGSNVNLINVKVVVKY